MPLELQRMTAPDIPDFVAIESIAFSNGISKKIAPKVRTLEQTRTAIEKHLRTMREPGSHYWKVVDTDIGMMIAGAKWRIHENERTKKEVEKTLWQPEDADENSTQAYRDFMSYLSNSRRVYMGTRPFCFLHILVTHPKHHRRGAGRKLVKWGTAEADRLRLPAYLEASDEGKKLYADEGFEVIKVNDFDLAKWGGSGVEHNTIMIRPAR